MKNSKANELIAKIIKEVESNSVNVDALIPMLTELREMAKMEQDPLITRSIRLVMEHLNENGGWEYQTLEDSEEAKSENKYNRDEIREIANAMTGL